MEEQNQTNQNLEQESQIQEEYKPVSQESVLKEEGVSKIKTTSAILGRAVLFVFMAVGAFALFGLYSGFRESTGPYNSDPFSGLGYFILFIFIILPGTFIVGVFLNSLKNISSKDVLVIEVMMLSILFLIGIINVEQDLYKDKKTFKEGIVALEKKNIVERTEICYEGAGNEIPFLHTSCGSFFEKSKYNDKDGCYSRLSPKSLDSEKCTECLIICDIEDDKEVDVKEPTEGPDKLEYLSYGYHTDGQNIYYTRWLPRNSKTLDNYFDENYKESFKIYLPEITRGVDTDTFEALGKVCNNESCDGIGKDKNYVYRGRGRIYNEIVDVNTLKYVDHIYFKDKAAIYYLSYQSLSRYEGLDIDTFEALNSIYSKDKHYVYIIEDGHLEILEDEDPDTFKLP